MIDTYDATYGEGYEVGYRDGTDFGRAQRGGEIVAGIIARAVAAEHAAASAPTVNLRAASASVAKWLRGLADEVKRGEL